MSFFGHQIRSKNSKLVSDITQGKIEGKRGRGRPKISYMDNMKQWIGMSMSDAIRACYDREGWRNIVMKAVRAANDLEDDAG